ncbi:putative NADH dehydrogenase [Actinacidiphila reveromycinica]|uniref:Putative NADH dehydrogenase n=2 Tax=Actinacidiphila reveromycinica TaxID=659352 RepID=A0A7U3UV03_9ACTN|nr:putative NADH dehydrogenase [Streptomyces sp. SN-593]
MYAALRLQRRLKPHEADIVVVEPQPYMTYQPFLPEAAAGSISPRHVVVPLRRVLDRCRIIVGEARSVDTHRRTATVDTLVTPEEGGNALEIPYDHLVLAPGSVSRTLPVPGLAEHGVGFKTVEEAIGLRNHVLEQLDIASSTRDAEVREAALTFVFVGGGYAGVEALAELENMARYAVRYYHNITTDDLRWVLVEASDHILPEVGEALGRYALRELRGRNIDIRLETRLDSCEHRIAVLSDGDRLPTRTLVWTAGVKPAPLLAATGLPLTGRGRLRVDAALRVEGADRVWSAGDAAAVPDLGAAAGAGAGSGAGAESGPGTGSGPGAGPGRGTGPGRGAERPDVLPSGGERPGADEGPECAPNAQHAVRQARVLADNLIADLHGGPLTEYRHVSAGAVASLGLHEGVALVRGRAIKGYPAWLIHRVYHLSRMPTFNRKARILAEWVLSGLFKREIVSLGSLEHPRAEFELAAGSERKPDAP